MVLDAPSGPGVFLEVALERFPKPRGSGSTCPMRCARPPRNAARSLALGPTSSTATWRGCPRRAYRTGWTSSSPPRPATTSPASTRPSTSTPSGPWLLGWLANLDHVDSGPRWEARLNEARWDFRGPVQWASLHHHHEHRPLTVDHHLEGLRRCGMSDVDTPWRAYFTVLIAARQSDAS